MIEVSIPQRVSSRVVDQDIDPAELLFCHVERAYYLGGLLTSPARYCAPTSCVILLGSAEASASWPAFVGISLDSTACHLRHALLNVSHA